MFETRFPHHGCNYFLLFLLVWWIATVLQVTVALLLVRPSVVEFWIPGLLAMHFQRLADVVTMVEKNHQAH